MYVAVAAALDLHGWCRHGSPHKRPDCPPLLQTLQAATLADKRIVVTIDGWEADSLYPSGHYVRTLGAIGDRETETEVG